ncbi:hypothetical protein C9374_001899 [Naegleria lovaniensis]|uniref:Homologous-pairing protein 2 winged helix domain-containing protein n=1 Tax=Naegleria lovaniensis TaxID=51637 RepID=A0AA88GVC9_NAELO|nr:uncharacterized protein C9374_001899 [Naegleria lovaniensis]KAG2386864.1 hypothetical protein C9374_001899 [Naegleria lovaniensis]
MAPKRKRTIADEEEEFQPEDEVQVIGSDDDDDDEFMENVVDDDDDDDIEFKEKASKKKKKDEDEEEEDGGKKKKKSSSKKSSSTKEKKETKKKSSSSSDKDSKKKSSGGKKGSTSSGPKKKDLTIKDESEARKVVLELFKKANPMATKCVDKLESKGELTVKASGKTKIWWINQDNLEVLSKEELKEIDNEIKELQQEIAGVRSDITQRSNTKAKLLKAPKTEELPNIILKERAELEQKKKKLESLQSGSTKLCTIEEKKEALKHLEKYLKEWKSRKRLTMSIVDSICEHAEKTRPA